jgi:6-phosphogluconolactonase (cycloisomerase 2 family)
MFAYVGSFTTLKRDGRGNGVNAYRVDPASGVWTHLQNVPELINPTVLAVDPSGRFLYSVHIDIDQVTAFAIRPSGELEFLNRTAAGSDILVAAALGPHGRFLITANYGSGCVAVLPLEANGRLGARSQLIRLHGEPGPHRTQQTSSHPHDVRLDPTGRFVLIPDKGLDRLFVFRLDNAKPTITQISGLPVACRRGAAPRHAAFHPFLPFAYVVNELDSTVTTYAWDGHTGGLQPLQILPTLPASFTGDNTSAEIVVPSSGRFVYVSNRGHDSIAIFAIDARTGSLTSVGWAASGGKRPRSFALDPAETFLYVANEASDAIVAFRVDPESGELAATGQIIEVASPTYIIFSGVPTALR